MSRFSAFLSLCALLSAVSLVVAALEARVAEPQGYLHGVPPSSELPADVPTNHAWKNSGTSYVKLDSDLTARLGTRGFTLEAWIYNENPAGANDQIVISHSENGVTDLFKTDFVLQVSKNTGSITFLMGSGNGYGFLLQGPVLTFNEWTHVAVSVSAPSAGDPTSARMYVNGEVKAMSDRWGGPVGSRQVSSNSIEIGHISVAGKQNFWVGQLDEVRIWATVRSQAMIKSAMTDPMLFTDPQDIPESLVAYYSFDAGPDSVVWDNSDQPWYDGTPINGQMRVPAAGIVVIPLSPLYAPFAGPEAFGLDFTGVHDQENYAVLPSALSRDLPRGFTFEAWIYLSSTDRTDIHYKTIVARYNQAAADSQPGTYAAGSNPEADFVFQVDPRNGRLVFFMGGGRGACESTHLGYGVALFSSGDYNVPAFEWTHVAFSVISSSASDPFSAVMYINGMEVPQAAELPGNDWHSECHRNYLRTDPIYLGFYDNGITQYWEGRIDEVRFWAEPRESAEILRDYMRPVSITTQNLLAYYLLNDGSGTVLKDSTGKYNALAVIPAWVLTQGPPEVIDGVSGYPVNVGLRAQSPYPSYPNNDTFVYIITSLPTDGGLFLGSEILEQSDVDSQRKINVSQLVYVSNIGFVGFDSFSYAAISANNKLTSSSHTVFLHITPFDDGEHCVLDACGVCNGDGMSCVGGCDGKGGQIDVCGVCAGEGASCTCVYYKTYHTDDLDCILFQSATNKTILQLQKSMNTLYRTLVALQTFDQAAWRNNFVDLGVPLEFLTDFLSTCLPPYEMALSEFEEQIAGKLPSCTPPLM